MRIAQTREHILRKRKHTADRKRKHRANIPRTANTDHSHSATVPPRSIMGELRESAPEDLKAATLLAHRGFKDQLSFLLDGGKKLQEQFDSLDRFVQSKDFDTKDVVYDGLAKSAKIRQTVLKEWRFGSPEDLNAAMSKDPASLPVSSPEALITATMMKEMATQVLNVTQNSDLAKVRQQWADTANASVSLGSASGAFVFARLRS